MNALIGLICLVKPLSLILKYTLECQEIVSKPCSPKQDGKNTLNVKSKVGIVSLIIYVLQSLSFGSSYCEIAITLREYQLINHVVTNTEVWYGLLDSDVDELEEVDRLVIK